MDFVFWVILGYPFEQLDFEGLPAVSVTGMDQMDGIVGDFVLGNASGNSESSGGDSGHYKENHHEEQQAAKGCGHPACTDIV